MALKLKTAAEKKIEKALIECIESGEFPKVTVAELIEKAGVSKSTFYRNYHDVYEVFEKLLDDFVDRIMGVVDMVFKNIDILNKLMVIFKPDSIIYKNMPFTKNDEVLVRYSLLGEDSIVIKKFMYAIGYRFRDYYISCGLSPIKAEVCARFMSSTYITYCLECYRKKEQFDLEKCRIAFEIVYALIEKEKESHA